MSQQSLEPNKENIFPSRNIGPARTKSKKVLRSYCHLGKEARQGLKIMTKNTTRRVGLHSQTVNGISEVWGISTLLLEGREVEAAAAVELSVITQAEINQCAKDVTESPLAEITEAHESKIHRYVFP